MNYLGHALPHLLQGEPSPWTLAGTALPDWVRVCESRGRVSQAQLQKHTLLPLAPHQRELLIGCACHLRVDQAFHCATSFEQLCQQLTGELRPQVGEPQVRVSFIVHVLIELLLDSAIEVQHPGITDLYYSRLKDIDLESLNVFAESLCGPLGNLSQRVDQFIKIRFLDCYADDQRLLQRLNQVLGRVGLAPAPLAIERALPYLRQEVRHQAPQLLHAGHPDDFPTP